MIHEMQQHQIHVGIYFHKDFEELKKAVFKKFKIIHAAGGFVQNEKQEVLMMFRRGKWDLPKGKLDKKETIADCAVRETEEETGLRNIELTALLLNTFHTYHEGSHFILKETSWFRMKIKGFQQLIPQTEEDISKLEWVNHDNLNKYMGNTFPSVRDVLAAGFLSSNDPSV
jgi:8-oxo-dGTP pyrophosphatase MutT (NUDIX family)